MAYDDPPDVHLEWCKGRARKYLNEGDHANAIASMMSDLGKHPDWQGGQLVGMMMMVYAVSPDIVTARQIIEGFN